MSLPRVSLHTLFLVFTLTTAVSTGVGQSAEEEIRSLLASQADAWNEGNIPEFMEGYHKSEDLHFLGKSGLTEGWVETLERYEKGYPDTSYMGKLAFDIQRVTKRTKDVYTVVGKFFLEREDMEDASGFFLLVVQRFGKKWKIVADSTH
jgi:hypothetical protein